MQDKMWILYLCLGIVAFLWVLSWFIGAYSSFRMLLYRKSPEKWARGKPARGKGVELAMFEAGCAWAKEHADRKRDVHICHDGLDFYGEFFDFGGDQCVVILPGRRDGLCDSYYYGIPYAQKGWSVLVLDARAHGLSGGDYCTVGFEEQGDNLAWVRFLEAECGIRQVVFHGICIGCAGGLFAAVSEQCPETVKGIVADGMYTTFAMSAYHHMRKYIIPAVPGLDILMIDYWVRRKLGHTIRFGPIHVIPQLQLPLLMLHSREDQFSTPKQAEKLFVACGSREKKLVWFDHGAHSQTRYSNQAEYDAAIGEFLENLSRVKV